MTAKSHPAAMRFIPDIKPKEETSGKGSFQSSDLLLKQPSRFLWALETFSQILLHLAIILIDLMLISDV